MCVCVCNTHLTWYKHPQITIGERVHDLKPWQTRTVLGKMSLAESFADSVALYAPTSPCDGKIWERVVSKWGIPQPFYLIDEKNPRFSSTNFD